ncbi:class I SAM-dependent methyltransferase [Acinetobacter rudis]|uniref:Ribosomal RNA small subunit methyltransferase C n=1 Tax=Acinetobacter rudis TaxID=632955 RepID=A0AAW8J7T2_9GAMM|nr:class I SAM-dependent methyltransferase [Acinetobacter rudis]MDQ8935497.1 class I SAM-dependent methyltransferase [Acinetobacter rudis]MDQ9017736.1 class I SAM-dependent methyltransferase [Acinetobacter rudis]
MDTRSEVVIRQQHALNGRVLFINAPADQLIDQLDADINATVWTWNYADHLYHCKMQHNSYFAVELPAQSFDQAIIFVPKSKNLLEYILHQVISHFDIGQNIFLVGEKKGGVERAAKQLKNYGKTFKLDSARHCQMWQATLEHNISPLPIESWIKNYSIKTDEFNLEICALPGVFSQDHLDIGTAVLLPYLKQVKSGTLADFGCGAGVLSCCLAKLNDHNIIHALDVDAFALKSTELSFERNQLDRSRLHLHAVTGIQDAPTGLDAVISNPPFHQGIHTNYAASENLCQTAKAHLKPQGELWIVANRFLNYASIIEQQFGQAQIKTDQNGFKVIYACTSQHTFKEPQ